MEISESRFSAHRLARLRATYSPASFVTLDLTADELLLGNEPPYSVYYDPVDSWPRPTDRVIFVGLTPGFSQLELAARLFLDRRAIAAETEGRDYDDALRSRVAFAGSMRRNLCQMLDDIDMPRQLGAACTAELFAVERQDISTTSALIFPTFAHGKNLAGLRAGKRVEIFDEMIRTQVLPRLLAATKRAHHTVRKKRRTYDFQSIGRRSGRS